MPGNFTEDGKCKLYTRSGPLQVLYYKMYCLDGTCVAKWTGEEEKIFRISNSICLGYEMGWDFIEAGFNLTFNFAGYCKLIASIYKRLNKDFRFVSSTSFKKWFFSWSSYQKIEFREKCSGCTQGPQVLACDATKIGISVASRNIKPIEDYSSNDETLETKNRRFTRCFIIGW